MKHLFTLFFGLAMLMATELTYAQSPFSFEFRTGVDFATQELGNADLNTGFGFEGTFAYRFMPHLSAYAGWGWHRFASDNSFAGSSVDFEETGYTFGLQFLHPLGATQLDYFVRAGGIYNHIEAENSDGDITADSGHGLGWQAETGLAFDIGNKWQLRPGVRYRSLSRDIEIGNTTTDTDLSYFEFGVGIAKFF